MFTKRIINNVFTSSDVNDLMSGIRYVQTPSHLDMAMLTVLRALCSNNGKIDAEINIDVDEVSALLLTRRDYLLPMISNTRRNFLYICFPDSDIELQTLQDAANFVPQTNSAWKCNNDVSQFFQAAFPTVCLTNARKKTTVLLIGKRLTNGMYHYLCCGALAYFPWYFNKKDGVSELSKQLLLAIKGDSFEEFNAILQQMYQAADIRSFKLKRDLAEFESKLLTSSIKEVERNIAQTNNLIDRHMAEAQRFINNLNELTLKQSGLILQQQSGATESTLLNYYLVNKNLELIDADADNRRILFDVRTICSYFDADYCANMLNNEYSILYSDEETALQDHDKRAALLKALFIDQTLRLKMIARYEIRIDNEIVGCNHINFIGDSLHYMPNPHIQRYSCLGNYRTALAECIRNKDYVLGTETCVASCQSLNFGDYAVMRHFVRYLFGQYYQDCQCIILPDGSEVTPQDAVTWLTQQETAETEN